VPKVLKVLKVRKVRKVPQAPKVPQALKALLVRKAPRVSSRQRHLTALLAPGLLQEPVALHTFLLDHQRW
jgi:hypothetical protein